MSDPEMSDDEIFRVAARLASGTATEEELERAKAEGERARDDE